MADFMVSDGTNFFEFVPSKADGVRDYNDPSRNIRIGFAGSSLGLGNSDAEQNVKCLAGYTESGKHIKDVNLNAARKYLGINNVNNTADSSKSVKYAANAGSANSSSYATKAGSADNEYCVMVQSAQPTDSRCKLWIKI